MLSGVAAFRVHQQELALDNIAFARAVDVHASLVQDRLTERELLSRVAAGLFRAPATVKANMLQPLRSAIYAFKTDFVVAAWIARVKPDELDAAQKELAAEKFAKPTIRDFDDQPLDLKAIDRPVNVLMDLEPRTPETIGIPGRVLDGHPSSARRWPRPWRKASRSPPIRFRCSASTDLLGIVLASPVMQEGATEPAGFVTFSYELGAADARQ